MAQAAVKSVMFVWEGRDKQGKKVKGEMSGKAGTNRGRRSRAR
jgi:hypothetical protein